MINFQFPSVIFSTVPISFHSADNNWFSIEERPPIAYVKLEILEGTDMKPSDINGEDELCSFCVTLHRCNTFDDLMHRTSGPLCERSSGSFQIPNTDTEENIVP